MQEDNFKITYTNCGCRIARIVCAYLSDQPFSLGSLGRKLPYLLTSLGMATSSVWEVRCDYKKDHYQTIFSTGKVGYLPFLRKKSVHKTIEICHYGPYNNKLTNTIIKTIAKPKISSSTIVGPTDIAFTSCYGKGIYHVDFEGIFRASFTPVKPTLLERWWMVTHRIQDATSIKDARVIHPGDTNDS